MKMRIADYIAKFLVQRGVTDLFVLTGNGAMYLNDGIASEQTLKYFCARNEAAAPMMAEAYARVKQSLGVVCVTSGPGSTNAVPGLAEAWVDAAPVLILSGQVQRSHTTHNAKIPGLRSFGTAEINIVPIVESITKYAVMVNDPNSIRYHLEKAYHLAMTGRPGPVWIDVPMDIQSAEINPEALEGYTPAEDKKLNQNLDEKVEEVVQLLKTAKKPLVVAGHGIRQGKAIEDFRHFIEASNLPIILSRLGQDLLPFSHPNNFGQGGVKGTRYCYSIMNAADLVIALGCRLAVPLIGHNFDAFSKQAKVVMVDIEEAELKKPGLRIDLPIHADVASFLKKLNQKLTQQRLPERSEWLNNCRTLKKNNPMILDEMKKNPINLYYFMSRLDALSHEKHILTTDAGSNYYSGGQVYHFEKGQREITSGTFAAMGLSIPLAIGASVAVPDYQILAVTGDGSLELNIQELKTLSYYKMNIKLFVINNGGYLSMRNWQDTFFEGRRIGSDDDSGAETLNLKKVAAAFDLPYACIDDYQSIDTKLKEIMSDNKPLFVEVICDDKLKIIEPMKDLNC